MARPVNQTGSLWIFKCIIIIIILNLISIHNVIVPLSSYVRSFTWLFDNRFDDHVADICIVGAGLSGAVIAERYATEMKQSVLVIEKRDHIGGNCYDYVDEETGIRVSKYGAHLFHTNYDRVWDYVQRFTHWIPYEHEVLAHINKKHVPVPVNIDTVNALFDLNIQNETEMDEW